MTDQPRYRIGVDVGGTHTDLVLLNSVTGSLTIEKVPSTPANPALAVLDGVGRFIAKGVDPAAVEFFSHGTTITTNALLQMRGARVGLMISAGYRAIQEVQNQARDGNPFDYFYKKPEPIAPQSLTREIPGRIDFEGNELIPLDEDIVRRAARELVDTGAESIAICYLFSFMNPTHEDASRKIIEDAFPDIQISTSSQVMPRIREWPRLSTTLMNAYLEPVLVRYILDLANGLDDIGVATPQRFLMQSNGGVMPFTAAISGGKTVHTLLSGPAAGAQAGAYLAADDAKIGLVTLDMGGTSCDIAFIEGGAPLETTEGIVDRRPLDVPALDLTTISAGGGSIAWIDRGGFLCVGPQSAGADPGPACYGKGGEEPTVTDADIACGFLNPEQFLGGAQSIDANAALAALKDKIGDPMGLTALQAAAGIRRIVDMRMADEVRVVAAKRGVDPQEFTLLPFGGAGAVHAAAVAEELGIRRILVPPRPGAFSALGLLCTDVVHDYIRSELRPLDQVAPDHAEQIFSALEARAAGELREEGLDPADAINMRELDMRYVGQGYELRVPLDGLGQGGLDDAAMTTARVRFDERHAQLHGHAAAEKSVEVVSYRLRVRVTVPRYEPAPPADAPPHDAPVAGITGTREVYFDGETALTTNIYERDKLDAGAHMAGPAIIEQFDATTVVPPGWTAMVDGNFNVILAHG
jgi:N-methylhydantoinase A